MTSYTSEERESLKSKNERSVGGWEEIQVIGNDRFDRKRDEGRDECEEGRMVEDAGPLTVEKQKSSLECWRTLCPHQCCAELSRKKESVSEVVNNCSKSECL